MDIQKIMDNLSNSLVLTMNIDINQEKLDKLLDYCIKNDLREKGWRLALTFSNYEFDFSALADYYIMEKDEWYLSELLYVIGNDDFNLKIYEELSKGNDKEFFEETLNEFYLSYYIVKSKEELEKYLYKK